ncbi:hypothetical protein KY325_01520 [Candidatus Woesearchaeota archaeon]|nr:hypothetical protein [Candidatus Woesearchaeota archaeon]
MPEKNYQKTSKRRNLLNNDIKKVPNETLLEKLKKEVSEFKDLMDGFNSSCGVKYGPRQIRQLFSEIKHYTDETNGYGKKCTRGDYSGAIEDLRYSIECLKFLPEIATPETIKYLIPGLKIEDEYNAEQEFKEYIDDQVKEIEKIIDQVHLDWESTNSS